MIDINLEQMDRLEIALADTPKKVPIAASRSINRALQSARTEAGRKARANYVIKHRTVLNATKTNYANPENLIGSVNAKNPVTALSKFDMSPNTPHPRLKKGEYIKVRVKANGGKKPIKSAFVAKMENGHVGVFIRAGKVSRRELTLVNGKARKVKEVPIKQLYGPSIPQMLGSQTVAHYVEEKARNTLEKRLDHEIDKALRGY